MKKFLSSFLIFSTLFSYFTPGYSCSAIFKNKKSVVISCPSSKSRSFANNKAALRCALSDLAKDKKFTDQIVKNYKKTHEDPLWLKIIKLPFKLVYKIISKIFDYSIGYWVGKQTYAVTDAIIKSVFTLLGVYYLYNRFPWVRESIDSLISALPANY